MLLCEYNADGLRIVDLVCIFKCYVQSHESVPIQIDVHFTGNSALLVSSKLNSKQFG
jgi:hypothetical protein